MNSRFLDLDDDLLTQLTADGHGTPGEVPFHFLRGVDRPVNAIDRVSDLLIHLPESTGEKFVYDLTKPCDTNRRRFFGQAVPMAWDPDLVMNGDPLPSPARAERYYRRSRPALNGTSATQQQPAL